MLLSLSFAESMMFVVPFLITGALSARLFSAAKLAEAESKGSKNLLFVLGVLFLILTLGIGACFGMMWDFHLDVT